MVDISGDGMLGGVYYKQGHVVFRRSIWEKVITLIALAGATFIVLVVVGLYFNVKPAQRLLQGVIGGNKQVEPEQSQVAPPRNVNSQQTAYFDHEGGPKAVTIKHKPVKLLEVSYDQQLFTCPKLITEKVKCKYHNGIEVRGITIYEKV